MTREQKANNNNIKPLGKYEFNTVSTCGGSKSSGDQVTPNKEINDFKGVCRSKSDTRASDVQDHVGPPSDPSKENSRGGKTKGAKCGYCNSKQTKAETFVKDPGLIAQCPPWARLHVDDVYCTSCRIYIGKIHGRRH